MPTRARAEMDRLLSSKEIPILLRVLSDDLTFRVPAWPGFVKELKEDLVYLRRVRCYKIQQDEWLRLSGDKANHQKPSRPPHPPFAPSRASTIYGTAVPAPRFEPPFAFDLKRFKKDWESIRAAFACRNAIWQLAQTGRIDRLNRCICGNYLFGRASSCSNACRKRRSRDR